MKKCPYCAEEIQDEAILCRFCKSRLDIDSFPNIDSVDMPQTGNLCPYCGKDNLSASTICVQCLKPLSVITDTEFVKELNRISNSEAKKNKLMSEIDSFEPKDDIVVTRKSEYNKDVYIPHHTYKPPKDSFGNFIIRGIGVGFRRLFWTVIVLLILAALGYCSAYL